MCDIIRFYLVIRHCFDIIAVELRELNLEKKLDDAGRLFKMIRAYIIYK